MIKIGSVTVIPGIGAKRSIYLYLKVTIKNSIGSRTNVIREGPGDSEIQNSDSLIALMTCIFILGNLPGYILFDVNENFIIFTQKTWYVSCLQRFVRGQIRIFGV